MGGNSENFIRPLMRQRACMPYSQGSVVGRGGMHQNDLGCLGANTTAIDYTESSRAASRGGSGGPSGPCRGSPISRAVPSPGDSMSWNDIRAIAARDCVSGPMSRRLNDIGAVSPWGYVSGPLSRNDEGAIATWDCVSGPVSRGLHNIALRLSRADKGQHRCCQNCFLHNAPPLERGHQGAPA